MNQYEYARDKRTDAEYEHQFRSGTHNQDIILDAYIAEKVHCFGEDWNWEDNPDKAFTKGSFGPYRPDCYLIHNSIKIPCEVKVQLAPLRKFVYVKDYQVDRLVSIGGVVFYSTPTKYFIMTAELWQTMEHVDTSPLQTPAYRIPVNEIQWKNWLYPPKGLRSYKLNGGYNGKVIHT